MGRRNRETEQQVRGYSILGRGTAKQEFRGCNWEGGTERQ